MSKLKISLITVTYNSIFSIKQSIESVNSQTYPNIERVWVDGSSDDGTRELLEKNSKDVKAVFISENDKGIYDALNKGLNIATGDIIGFLHADDILADNNVLSEIADAFLDPSVIGVFGDLVYVKKNDTSSIVRYWRAGEFSEEKLSLGWMPPHPTLYLRRFVYEIAGNFDLQYQISADYDFILRIFKRKDFKFYYLQKIIVKMRTGGISNRSISKIAKKSWEDYRAITKNRVGGLRVLFAKNIYKISQFWNHSGARSEDE